jgi:hypothetical protein
MLRLREWAARWLVGAAVFLYDLFIPIQFRCISFPTRYLEVFGAFLPNMISRWSHQPLSFCRSFFGFCDVSLDCTSHPSGSRSAEKRELLLCNPCPLPRAQKIFGSRPCPNRLFLQDSWLLASPSWLTAWAVKTLMTL